MPRKPNCHTLPIQFLISLLFVCASDAAGAQLPQRTDRPRITGIDHVSIYVSDRAKSHGFYSHILGLNSCPGYDGSGICFLVQSNQRIILKRAPAQIRTNPHARWLAEIGFATDNAAQMRAYLLAHSQRPGAMQKDSDGTQSFRMLDPEGNPIAFVQRTPPMVEFVPSARQISSRLIHSGFVVKDQAAENRFYVDLLGFRLYWYGGFKDDGTDWYEIQVPDGPDWIEYMLNIPANADHKNLGVQNHFSFGVKDVHAAAAELRARGLRTFDGPEIGRDGKDSLDAYDPDATRIEIMNFTPTHDPCCHAYTADHPKP